MQSCHAPTQPVEMDDDESARVMDSTSAFRFAQICPDSHGIHLLQAAPFRGKERRCCRRCLWLAPLPRHPPPQDSRARTPRARGKRPVVRTAIVQASPAVKKTCRPGEARGQGVFCPDRNGLASIPSDPLMLVFGGLHACTPLFGAILQPAEASQAKQQREHRAAYLLMPQKLRTTPAGPRPCHAHYARGRALGVGSQRGLFDCAEIAGLLGGD
jgi:hypothetical protein